MPQAVKARVIICEAELAPRIDEIREHLPNEMVYVRARPGQTVRAPWRDFESLRRMAETKPAITVRPTDLAMILYTSGTTGPSKGCMVTHNYACSIGRRLVESLEITASDVGLSPLPLFHIYGTCGILLSSMQVGARVALFAKFSVSQYWADVAASGATIAHLVGSMIALLGGAAETPDEKRCFGQLRVACGIPFSMASIELWRRRFGVGWAGNIGYGLTEFGRVCAVTIDGRTAPDTCGKPSLCEVRIFDDDDGECEPGKSGEIVVRPLQPGVMFDGYWRRPQETLEVMRGLWFHTGDIGRFDRDGNLIFVDRKKDYMRRGGENISGYELEEALRRHPDVLDIAAYGVPSPLSEDEVKISVILQPGSGLTEVDLCRWAAERLPYFCVPRFIEFHDDFPRGPTGKILKYLLKERGIGAGSWDRAASDIVLVKR
jgi:crotonobetaine/carnitine-CoA ligase